MKLSLLASRNLGHYMNVIGVMGVSLSLLIAFFYQLFFYELPCPLCLLQRASMIMVGLAFMLNVRFGEKGRYYGMALLSAVCTGIIATRQVLLHIVPGSGSYGSALFGVHFYTWALLSSVATIIYVAVMLVFYGRNTTPGGKPNLSKVAGLTLVVFAVLIAANLVFTMLECGFGQCADDPTFYEWLVSRY
jgi:disulfide bond formation protein DsbB